MNLSNDDLMTLEVLLMDVAEGSLKTRAKLRSMELQAVKLLCHMRPRDANRIALRHRAHRAFCWPGEKA